jgi:stage II sporulation protein R
MPAHKWFALCWAALMAIVLFVAVPADAPVPAEALLRLHVRANSDNPNDQAVKYQVRNAVLAVLQSHLETAGDADTARQEVESVLPEIIAAAQATVNAAGFDYTVRASLGEADFPTRLYGDQVYRAGCYQALQIFLGEGGGENWWCVLFPPLCFVEAAPDSAIPAVGGQKPDIPRPRSRILEWFGRIFRS